MKNNYKSGAKKRRYVIQSTNIYWRPGYRPRDTIISKKTQSLTSRNLYAGRGSPPNEDISVSDRYYVEDKIRQLNKKMGWKWSVMRQIWVLTWMDEKATMGRAQWKEAGWKEAKWEKLCKAFGRPWEGVWILLWSGKILWSSYLRGVGSWKGVGVGVWGAWPSMECTRGSTWGRPDGGGLICCAVIFISSSSLVILNIMKILL